MQAFQGVIDLEFNPNRWKQTTPALRMLIRPAAARGATT
jgi:hypothetical protein